MNIDQRDYVNLNVYRTGLPGEIHIMYILSELNDKEIKTCRNIEESIEYHTWKLKPDGIDEVLLFCFDCRIRISHTTQNVQENNVFETLPMCEFEWIVSFID